MIFVGAGQCIPRIEQEASRCRRACLWLRLLQVIVPFEAKTESRWTLGLDGLYCVLEIPVCRRCFSACRSHQVIIIEVIPAIKQQDF